MPLIIDVHAHIFPNELAPRALSGLSARANIAPHTNGTVEGLLVGMENAGIDFSVVQHIAVKPAQAEKINAWAEQLMAHKGILCFGALHPDMPGLPKAALRLKQAGFRGVKLHPDYQGFFADDKAAYPLYAALADAGLIALFHAGEDIGLPPPVHAGPERLARVAADFPALRIIAAHMGGYRCWGQTSILANYENVYLDTSYAPTLLSQEEVAALIRTHGAGRVLFGTDSPWAPQKEAVAFISGLNLTPKEINGVLGENARKLLQL